MERAVHEQGELLQWEDDGNRADKFAEGRDELEEVSDREDIGGGRGSHMLWLRRFGTKTSLQASSKYLSRNFTSCNWRDVAN